MKKLLFILKNAWLHRKIIKQKLNQHKHQLITITDLKPITLKKHNIKYLAIDFDGVLGAHGQEFLCNKVYQWLITLSREFNSKNIFILSNKVSLTRIDFFKKHFPSIYYITGIRKKPYPDGLLKIQQLVNCKPAMLALIDDRILTGYLASILAGAFPILIISPYKDYRLHPFKEFFFILLRTTERIVYRYFL